MTTEWNLLNTIGERTPSPVWKPLQLTGSEANSMQINMKFLWHSDDECLDSLRQDGWVILTGQGDREIEVSHPQVTTEDAARIRLHRLGLLTSRALRIDFWPSCQIFPQQK